MKYLGLTLFSFTLVFNSIAQTPLTTEMLEESALRFTLNKQGQLDQIARDKWLNWIGNNQYVGLAEVHNSVQLSYFTKALLNVLSEKQFNHFAMEMGPNTAELLQNEIIDPDLALQNIKKLNRLYGKKSSSKTPLIFVNKLEDAIFMEEASRLGYLLWGLDQEFAGSYEMLLDQVYKNSNNRDSDFKDAYIEAKSAIRKVIFKNKTKGQSVYCWYPSNDAINHFFSLIKNEESKKVIEDIKKSWSIYCQQVTGRGSNQARANYMKENFETYLDENGSDSKLFLKLGGIHLTHDRSHYNVDDIGKYLSEKAKQNSVGFLNIRHLITYRNGKSNIGKSGWKNTSLLLEIGRKDK